MVGADVGFYSKTNNNSRTGPQSRGGPKPTDLEDGTPGSSQQTDILHKNEEQGIYVRDTRAQQNMRAKGLDYIFTHLISLFFSLFDIALFHVD